MFIKAFKKSAGNIAKACDVAGIARSTYYEWMGKSDIFKKEVEDVKEGLIDFAESQLMKNIKDGKETSLIFFLKTQGKKRGYVEKQEIEHDGGTENNLTVSFGKS